MIKKENKNYQECYGYRLWYDFKEKKWNVSNQKEVVPDGFKNSEFETYFAEKKFATAAMLINKSGKVIYCKDCKEPFLLSSREIDFYDNRALAMPKRCAKCRKKNKEEKAKQETAKQ